MPDYRVKQGYTIHLSHQRILRSGDLLQNPSPDLVRDNIWKLEPVNSGTAPITEIPLPANEKPEGVSIIIPAWRAADWLRECLDSLAAQSYFAESAEYEILLGIDGCKSTKKRALKIANGYKNLTIYWFNNNYGPYLIKNSLAAKAKQDCLLFFDSDDTAEPNMLECLLAHERDSGGPAAVYMMGENRHGEVKQTCGVFLIGRHDFLRIGGFMPWPCAADTEFMKRLPAAKISHRCCEQVLMRRRVHKNQITVKPDTGFGSELRTCYMRQIQQMVKIGIANIGLVTAESERLV